ncbi:hypothetical protein FB565_007548 [Actinoplanes lutulentus]|uniref:hypothetical protein n=1 Tax=Actinoplanes lutulentus TaxID=1287878 RepID=UPI0011B93665|nr:hypothetical protein [Actinoplanes lutulentus]MBB2947777.1 hypothetical protein [Actinoplanes lutulentus]
MDGFVKLFVDYCQYVVHASGDASGVGIYKIGDGLVHPGGPTVLTGFCGTHTGWIEARARVLDGEPEVLPLDEWDAVSEATLWCPSGRFSVRGLMGGSAPELSGIAVPRGLIRVRVHARDRLHETVRGEGIRPSSTRFWCGRLTRTPGGAR